MQVIELYHHGSLFSDLREEYRDSTSYLVANLSTCMFCLAPWVAGLVVLWYTVLPTVLRIVIYILAVTRAANLVNDLTHGYCRTPDNRQS